ncbi:MAG: aspartate-semialdehyde dehydrogenase [Spirochaetes bacterium]|nr:aspartate-semialdehyde dehydrogenase [Spirochaetota bacterium]MBU1079066.1 aspartate-semialdehyde dehydrogenase [Spirochaetota bacterium]
MQRIPVAILGATGAVGQRLVSILFDHPWFEPVALCASERSAGKPYGQSTRWMLPDPMPQAAATMAVRGCAPFSGPAIAFSALDADVASEIEEDWAKSGRLVVSNARCHRMRVDVPLVVPELNADHLRLVERQPYPGGGAIVTNPNCSTIGLVMALKPLDDAFGLRAVNVVTLQAASGAGYPGVPFMDLIDNAVPYIHGEEEKLEAEPIKILGRLSADGSRVEGATFGVSAACHRVAVSDGHLEAVSVSLERPADRASILRAWMDAGADTDGLRLPSAPERPLVYIDAPDRPQPRFDRGAGKGMSATLGRLRPCSTLGWKFELLSHNTLRGAAGGTVLLAELCVVKGLVPRAAGFAVLGEAMPELELEPALA